MNLLRGQQRQAWEAILIISSVCTMTLHAQQSATTLVFYIQPHVSNDLLPALFQVLRADLEDEATLPESLRLEKGVGLVQASDDLRGVSFSHIISVKLLGRCDVLPQTNNPSRQGPLGWVFLVSGKIQPFISIDCTRLAQELRPAIPGLNKQERRYAMLQAIAHVLLHEWSHIATQNPAHNARGLTRPDLTVRELIAAPKNTHLSAASR
jgi:hypothetical protein